MKPGSTDGILTVLASVLVTALLFIAQHFTSAPRTIPDSLPEDNLAESSPSAQTGTVWTGQTKETRTTSTSSPGTSANPFDSPFAVAPSEGTQESRSAAPPDKLPSISSSTRRTPPPETTRSTAATTRTFGPSTPGTTRSGSGGPDVNGGSRSNNQRVADSTTGTFKVVSIIDGDTVDLLVNYQPVRLRLNGIDTPEKGQPFGNAAKDALSQAIGGQSVQYVVRDTDRYNRAIADVYFRGVHINKWLVQKGLAWHYKAYNNDPVLSQAEQEAAAAKRGLWADPRRVAPWNWRKLSKLERDQYR